MIKYCSILVCLWLILPSSLLRAQFVDDFSDGDFTSDPEWSGDVDHFIVNDNFELQLNAPEAGSSYLSTPHNLVQLEDQEWRFNIGYGFNPSNQNGGWTYLTAVSSDLSSSPDGIYFRIGETGANDPIELFERADGTETLILSSTPAIVASSFFITVRIIYSANGDWELSYDLSGEENFQLDVVQNYPTTIVGNHFGFSVEYTSSNTENFRFDNIYVGDIIVDTEPPTLISVNPTSTNELEVLFSEAVNSTSEIPSNYSVSEGIGNANSAIQDSENPDLVTLTFDNNFVNGQQYTLTVTNVEDLSENPMSSQEIAFQFIIPEIAEYKDIVINEIMADPNPPVDLPNQEFLELYNVSDKYIELENWEISISTADFPAYIIEPGEYLILCQFGTAELLETYGNVLEVLTSGTALTNAGTEVVLSDSEGSLIDIVNYSDAWYNDPEKDDGGWTLELINPETECSGSLNWTASNDLSGGTPGEQNSVYDTTPDTSPPVLTDFNIIDPQNIELFFNEPLDPASLADATVTIDPATGIDDVSMADDNLSIFLELDAPIDTAVSYTVSIENITDCIGNAIADENSIQFLIGFIPEPHEVLINEIMPDPSPSVGLPEQEYIELYNPTDKLFDLSGCNISGSAFLPNTFIEPEGYLVLVSPGASGLFEDYPTVVEMAAMSSTFLTNGGRELLLANPGGNTVDRISYDLSWYNDASKTDGGWSIERINPEEPCRGGDNWRASVATVGGTPGAQNSVYDLSPDESAPQLNTILYEDSTTVELVFNEVLDEASVISAGYAVEPELVVFDIENVAPDNTRIRLTFSEALVPNQIYTISIVGLTDCSGNAFENEGNLEFGRPGPVTAGNLIINEILFNQRTGGSDFVEIYNNSNALISLQDWLLGNLGNDQLRLITDEGIVLFPGQYLAITDDKANILAEYPFAPAGRVYQSDDIPTYNNSDGQAVLLDPNGNTVDRFDYDEDMHFALLNTVKGVSLERIHFDRPSDDMTNWMSAAETYNWGTPGFQNSQFQELSEAEGDVSVDPEIFSPDNDGYRDVLNINYKFERSGLAASITIYTSTGLAIRQLTRNEFIGSEGTVTWDGTDDNGERARVGIHVVYVEVFDTDGWTQSYKLSCVVASRF